jgi:uncharacterized protein YjiS (DUF1127 family)
MPFDLLASPAAATAAPTTITTGSAHGGRRSWAASCGAALMSVLAAWHGRRERARMHRQLLTMDDRMLRDIGLSRCDASLGIPRVIHRP